MNRSSGAYEKTIWHDFGIYLKLDDGGYYQTVKRAPTRRMALGMAFRDTAGKGKVAFCKRADEMTADERGQWDLQTSEDLIGEAELAAYRRAQFNHFADLY